MVGKKVGWGITMINIYASGFSGAIPTSNSLVRVVTLHLPCLGVLLCPLTWGLDTLARTLSIFGHLVPLRYQSLALHFDEEYL